MNHCMMHATRAAAHLAKILKIVIAICPAIIPAADITHFKNLFDSIVGKANVHKHESNKHVGNPALHQDSAVLSMMEKK